MTPRELITTAAIGLLMSGCVVKIGEVSAYSTKDIDLTQPNYTVDTSRKVCGESAEVTHSVLGFGNKRPNLGSAVANAEASVPNCVGLANVTINYGFRPYIIYENHRFVVEGNPIIKK